MNEKAGQSGQKSGKARQHKAKCTLKLHLVFLVTARVRNWYCTPRIFAGNKLPGNVQCAQSRCRRFFFYPLGVSIYVLISQNMCPRDVKPVSFPAVVLFLNVTMINVFVNYNLQTCVT